MNQTKLITVLPGLTRIKYIYGPAEMELYEAEGSHREGLFFFTVFFPGGKLGWRKRQETVSFSFWELFKFSKADFPEEGGHVWDTFIPLLD